MTDDLDHIEGIDEPGGAEEFAVAGESGGSSQKIAAVGIDLGTTNSVIAYLDDAGRPQTIVNSEGELLTPTAVLFEPMTVVVGREALKAVATEAEFVADCAKREIGSRSYHKAFHGSRYPPEVIHAFVLHQLKTAARRQLGDVRHAVISVPAYFDDVRRQATQDAGFMAGIEVLDIINEPTAAAVAFGLQQGYLNTQGEATQRQKVLVYDLGGGTFDVTVMDISGRDFTAMAIDGDVKLGGRDWDERLMNFIGDEFVRQHDIDPRETVNAAGRLWRECEDAKRTLSARPRATIAIDYKGHNVRVDITRQKFEEITCDLLDRTRFTTRQVMKAAGLEWSDLDRVLLVGGSTRMPMVREMLKDLSGKQPDASVSADEVVAHGAALHAGLILARSKGETPSFKIKNVNAHSLGVAAIDPKSQSWRNAVLIPRNSTLPITAQRDFLTQKADQRSILVQIVEGESSVPDECSQIGKCIVKDLPAGLAAQTPIQVKFTYAENGRLTIHVSVAGKVIEHELSRANSLSEEQLKRWRQTILEAMEGEDAA